MAIHVCRSSRAEDLVARLCQSLKEYAPRDPFAPVPIVVGSRGMERWLRHEIATELRIAARLAFPFPRQAFDGAAAWLLEEKRDPQANFWEVRTPAQGTGGASADDAAGADWRPDALTFRVLWLLREHAGRSEFGAVARYLRQESGGADGAGAATAAGRPIGAREVSFAGEVAAVLDRLLHDRPDVALAWAEAPDGAPERHQWLAFLLHALGASSDAGSPALLQSKLRERQFEKTGRRLFLFGLSTLGPGDRALIASLGRALHIHLHLLVPSDAWWADVRTKPEACLAWRRATRARDVLLLEEQLAAQNPVLASLGLPSRDLQVWLEALDEQYHEEVAAPASEPAPGAAADETAAGDRLLPRLQRWVAAAEGLPETGVAAAGGDETFPVDDSVSFRSTYGAMRQCEVLRDELLAMFAADSKLEPRHVAIMTPDVETYAPLVAAVFARRGIAITLQGEKKTLPGIPTAIADLGLRRTNPVAEVLLQVLDLAGERITAPRLLDFVALEPVRLRFGLSADDAADIRVLVRESGLRWALDADDREAALHWDFGAEPEAERERSALDQNSVRFALERLALGVCMPDEEDDPLATVHGTSATLPPAVPFPLESRERIARFGQLAAIVRRLTALRTEFATAASLPDWCARLRGALGALTATSPKAGWLRAEVDERLTQLAAAAAPLGEQAVERAAVLRWLRDGFEMPQRGDRPITGAVTVSALEPMRSVPFRVIALLGMDDGSFPRGGQPRTWDPFSDPEKGERDRRTVDRHLLLEALLSARQRLIVLWAGRDVRTGKDLPAAVPIEELLEILSRLTGKKRSELVRLAPLQPWSRRNFGVDEERDEVVPPTSFDGGMAEAASALSAISRGESPTPIGLAASGTAALEEEREPVRTIELEVLAGGLTTPQRLLLHDRLGLRLAVSEETIEDREPLVLDHLDKWKLRDRLLGAIRVGDAPDDEVIVDTFAARLAGEGTLPIAAGGRRFLQDQLEKSRQAIENFNLAAGEPTGTPLALRVRFDDGTEIIGSAPDVREKDGRLLLEWLSASKEANERACLAAWVHVVAAAAMGLPIAGARLVGAKEPPKKRVKATGTILAWTGDEAEARRCIEDLASIWRLARRRPLALFRRSSSALAGVLVGADAGLGDPGLRRKAESAVRAGWQGKAGAHGWAGDKDDVWVAPCFAGYDPTGDLDDPLENGFLDLTRRVWLPMERAKAAGAELAETWGVAEGEA